MSTDIEQEIRLRQRTNGEWVAIHEPTGVGARGETRSRALEELDEAVALHRGEGGEPIEDEEAFLRDLGIDPDEVEPTEDLPEFMQ
ncbi:MAG: type II toxin-antitoxin system HicB family antitoxin [Halobacteriales archaeon]